MSSVVISGDTSGTVSLTVPAVAGTNTATLPAATGIVMVSGNMPAFSVYMSANQTPSNNVSTKCALDTIVYDTANCFNTSTYRFTPNVAGYYQINGTVSGYSSSTALVACTTFLQKNGATNFAGGNILNVAYSLLLQPTAAGIVYLNGTTDYVELYGQINASVPGSQVIIGTSQLYTTFSGCLVRAA